jgi:class 3 adenylate cyclase/tetratricopeptide (TPR) repeat protein
MERKLATVLFVDLVDSTALVSGADPEVVRRRVTEFFDQVTRCVISYGGIVEKFAGDAVLAGFGVAQSHEDDAERAVRAALAILQEVEGLGLEARIGIESGEVVVEEADSTFATGEAVNLAARLQQAAAPGEILIGPGAQRLTTECLELEPLEPLQLRGWTEPMRVWRVVGAREERTTATVSAPLIAREAELELLENTYTRTVRDRRASLVTIFGEPGVGKSRLAREFVATLEGTTVLVGRALPYGEGITYWPLGEMVKVAAGITDDEPVREAMAKLRACCEDEAVADLLALASGVLEAVDADRSQQEIAWAAREWAEQLADVQPLVLVFEDIHWAEDPLLELVEHLATWVREAPLLLVCLARPELLDHRPGWGGGRLRASSIELEPLREDESERLLEALLGDDGLPEHARRALLEKTEGNPLFVEETIRMLRESGEEFLPEGVPDTLQALIAARIDRLPSEEKALLHRAAVIGRVFWRGALAHVADGDVDVDALLEDLVLRDFVLRESRSTIAGEHAYRFKHVLIREVAYAGVAKSQRARHHAAFAEWLRERAGEELLEIRAYHLDHAAQLLAELDGAPPDELRREAAQALEIAGKRALAREANRSGRKLLCRAVELEPTLERRYHAARAAWRLSDFPVLAREMTDVLEAARATGDRAVEGKALTALAEAALLRDADVPRAKQLVEAALDVLEPDARFTALRVRGTIAYWEGDLELQERVTKEALEIARRLRRIDFEAQAVGDLANVYRQLHRLDEAQEMTDRAVALAEESGSIVAHAAALVTFGDLQMLQGEVGDAVGSFSRARDLFAEAGDAWQLGRVLKDLAWATEENGDVIAAEQHLRESMRLLTPLEDRGTLCETQRALAELLVKQERLEEAERFALAAVETVGEHDVSSRASTTMTLGKLRAAQGRENEGLALFREAADLIEDTGFFAAKVWILTSVEEFLRDRGRDDEAAYYAERLAELAPVAAVGSAFATKIARIA